MLIQKNRNCKLSIFFKESYDEPYTKCSIIFDKPNKFYLVKT